MNGLYSNNNSQLGEGLSNSRIFAMSVVLVFLANFLLISKAVTVTAAIIGDSGSAIVENVNSVKEDKEVQILSLNKEIIEAENNRNPKFLFNLTMPIIGANGGIEMPGFGGAESESGTGGGIFGGSGTGNLIGTLGTSAILLKGGLLGTLTALKAAILPPLFLAVIVAFLVAGAAFFTCSVVDCGSILTGFDGGGFGPGFGGLPNSFSGFNVFNRNSVDYYDQQGNPIYQALENGYKKYGDDGYQKYGEENNIPYKLRS